MQKTIRFSCKYKKFFLVPTIIYEDIQKQFSPHFYTFSIPLSIKPVGKKM
jgi:hypothetical protein